MKRVLCIGNSFSEDATRYLQKLAGGELWVRNCYIAGCSLQRHYENSRTAVPEYQYQEDAAALRMISLREALFTQFKVPIVEEYSRVYTVSRALAEAGKSVGSNYAHIDLGDRAVVQIVQKEQPVALRSEGQADITGLLLPEGGSLLELAQSFEAAPPAQQAAALKSEQSPVSCFTVRLSNVARMLCSLFAIEKLYLSGPAAASPAFMRGVVQKLKSPEMRPVVLNPDPVHTPAFMATDLRQSLLCSTDA